MGAELILWLVAIPAAFAIGATFGMYIGVTPKIVEDKIKELDARTFPDVEKKEDAEAFRKKYLSIVCNNCGQTVPAVGMECVHCKVGSGREVHRPATTYAEMMEGK